VTTFTQHEAPTSVRRADLDLAPAADRRSLDERRWAELVDESAARCRLLKLTPTSVRRPLEVGRPDWRLHHLAEDHLFDRLANVARTGAAILLADPAGTICEVWPGSAPLMSRLAAVGVRPGSVVTEAAVGTSSFSAAVSRCLTVVRGREHLHPALQDVTSAGAVVVQPETRRVLGSLHVIVMSSDTGASFIAPWLDGVVRELETLAYQSSTRADSVLMDRFLHENRDSRHAVVALSEKTIITNAAAARLVGVEEQSVLWQHACEVIRSGSHASAELEVGGGQSLHVLCEPVMDGVAVVGAVMRLKRVRERSADQSQPLRGLVGSGPAWESLCSKVSAARSASMLLVGERGTGKSAVARASAAGTRVQEIDAHYVRSVGPSAWFERLKETLATNPETMIVRHVDRLRDGLDERVAGAINARPDIRFIGTSIAWPGEQERARSVLDRFDAVVPVPTLGERPEDLPALIKHFTRLHVERNPQLDGVQWMTDALQALSRVSWPANVTSLRSVVQLVLEGTTSGYVGVRDLPPDLIVRASGRSLTGLERIEANAILHVLKDTRGNKHLAAEMLGIARSTLYRRMRSLGIDLGASTY
jgi:transcriptional regulator of acetoin/glycerol metabolism